MKDFLSDRNDRIRDADDLIRLIVQIIAIFESMPADRLQIFGKVQFCDSGIPKGIFSDGSQAAAEFYRGNRNRIKRILRHFRQSRQINVFLQTLALIKCITPHLGDIAEIRNRFQGGASSECILADSGKPSPRRNAFKRSASVKCTLRNRCDGLRKLDRLQ